MQRKKRTAKVEKRCRWTLGELIEMEFGITCTPASSGNGRPSAGTPANSEDEKDALLQSTSSAMQQGETA